MPLSTELIVLKIRLGFDPDRSTGDRVHELDRLRQQHQTRFIGRFEKSLPVFGIAIKRIAHQRVAQHFKMAANLVEPAREWKNVHQ